MARYLVTGCAGFIGSHLTEALLARGDEVVGVDAFTDYYERELKERNLSVAREHAAFSLIEADLAEAELPPLLEGVDGVFHLAAQPGVRASWGFGFDVYVHNNVRVTQRLFEAASAPGVARDVFASSSSVYGDAERYPTREDDARLPVSPVRDHQDDVRGARPRLRALVRPGGRGAALLHGLRAAAAAGHGVCPHRPRPHRREPVPRAGRGRAVPRLHVRLATRLQPRSPRSSGGEGAASLQRWRRERDEPARGDSACSKEHAGRKLDTASPMLPQATCAGPPLILRRVRADTGWAPRVSLKDGLSAQFDDSVAHV